MRDWSPGRMIERLSGLLPANVEPSEDGLRSAESKGKGKGKGQKVNSVRPGLETPIGMYDPRLTEPHISCRLVSSNVSFLEQSEGSDVAQRVLKRSGLPRKHLMDDSRWVSTTFIDKWTQLVCKELTGLDTLPGRDHPHWQHYREAGRASLTAEFLGPLYWVLRTLGSAGAMYRQLPRQAQRGNRSIRMRVLRQSHGQLDLEVRNELPGAFGCAHCWNTRGLLETTPTIWAGPEAEVEHTECMHDPIAPSNRCVYRITYRERPLRRVMKLAVPTLIAAAGVSLGAGLVPEAPAAAAGAAGTLALSLLGWLRAIQGNRQHLRDMDELERSLMKSDGYVQRLWEENRRHHRALLTNRKLSGYLSAELVEQVLASPDTASRLGGESVDAAILFADIVGFTSRSEKMDPTRVVQELNHYFSYIDPVIEAHDGVLDKRMGDGVMVVFVPRGGESPESVRRRALRCGLALLRTVDLNNPISEARGIAPIEIRVGIAAGPTVQGNIGSDAQIEYTVIGDTVNLGSRLESRAAPGHLMITDALFDAAEAEDLRMTHVTRRESLRIRGRDQAQQTVELQPHFETG